MKKIKTISTLVAGLGIAFLGHTTHADAAENNNQQQSTYNYSTTEVSFSNSGNLYTSGQCTWYVYDCSFNEYKWKFSHLIINFAAGGSLHLIGIVNNVICVYNYCLRKIYVWQNLHYPTHDTFYKISYIITESL